MADVLVKSGKISDGKIDSLTVELYKLGSRTLDRDTVLSWMRDGHSFIPLNGGKRGTALQLVEDGEGGHFIRPDNTNEGADALPELG